jgi:hypothetical protein
MVEMVEIHQVMWFVMLESAKDRVIGVDTPGQQVPLRVRYGTTCLLIRDAVGSVPYSDEYENWRSYLPRLTWCKRGHGITVGIVTHLGLPRETLALLWYCDYLS